MNEYERLWMNRNTASLAVMGYEHYLAYGKGYINATNVIEGRRSNIGYVAGPVGVNYDPTREVLIRLNGSETRRCTHNIDMSKCHIEKGIGSPEYTRSSS